MQLIPIAKPVERPATLVSARAIEAVGGLIGCVGSPHFASDGLARLNRLVDASWWSVFRLYDDAPPRMPMSGAFGCADDTLDSWREYRSSLYRGDTMFLEAGEQTSAQQQTLVHWNAREIRRTHRERIYQRHGVRERVSLICREPDHSLLAVNLYRHDALPAFSARDVDALVGVSALVLSCVQRHLALHPASLGAGPVFDTLTPRERAVCERMLKAWTYEGIAADLGVTPGTVKTYRDRAFEKLGIRHRHELFALVAGTLQPPDLLSH